MRDVVIPTTPVATTTPSATTAPLLIIHDGVRQDWRNVAALDLVRLLARDADGREHAMPWSITHAGATLEFGSAAAKSADNASGNDTTTRNLVLVGADPALSLRR